MHRFLMIYEQESVSQKMFMDFLMKHCDKCGHRITAKRSRNIKGADIEGCDILIAVRSMNPLETGIFKLAQKAGKTNIVFWDDDLLCDSHVFVPKLRRKAIIDTLKYADAIISPNHYLASKLAQHSRGAAEILIDTAVDIEELYDKEDSELVKIVYAAGPSHDKDFDINLENAFDALQEKLKGGFSLTFVGAKPELRKNHSFPIEYVDSMGLEEYRNHMKEANYDIGLAIVSDSEFSKSKYYNKFIEYTITNVVGIYSNWPPYTLVIKNGINGFMADKSAEAWFEALYEAVSNPEKRRACLDNAKMLIKDEFGFETISKKFEQDIKKLSRKDSKRINVNRLKLLKLCYYPFKYLYLPVVYLSEEGHKGTQRRIKNYLSSIKLLRESK